MSATDQLAGGLFACHAETPDSGTGTNGIERTLDSLPATAHGVVPAHSPLGGKMERFVHQQNLEHYRRLLAETNVADDKVRHAELLKLLAAEIAKDAKSIPGDR